MARDHVPGLCIGIVSGNDRRLRCYGLADAGSGRPVDGSSRFGVASVSKTFAALGVLTLAADGAFGLDDPVERHLRSWRFPRGPFDGSIVTIRQVLTHTGGVGVPSYGGAAMPAPRETTRDVLDGRAAGREPVRLVAVPGSSFRYSGGGYVVLQQLVEDASGVGFERFMVERVFRPLGMVDSSFSWGRARDGDTAGHDVGGHRLARRRYGAAMAPGAMVTTGNDMLRFLVALAESTLPALLGWSNGAWDEFVAPDHAGYGMALVVGRPNGHLLVGHSRLDGPLGRARTKRACRPGPAEEFLGAEHAVEPVIGRELDQAWMLTWACERDGRMHGEGRGVVVGMPALVRMRQHDARTGRAHDALDAGGQLLHPHRCFLVGRTENVLAGNRDPSSL
jgi:CubicO group peptidase (beta-lactamase class C family)